ncbi:hypothetical protein [Paraburkholderia bannensis]|uniref:hypothetical protein n=1 Tax=Paraburkholderia bannensis TaxID=765414 RepID=UPI002AB73F41|nr:hypothetical protein [Paraburkholderia bannensis]
MPSCRQSDPFRVKPWLAHTPQPDDPPPDQPGTPDVPPVGDPPPQPAEVPRSIDPRFYPAMRVAPSSDKRVNRSEELACEQQAHIARIAQRAGRAAWARWARWASWICNVELGAQQAAERPSDVDARVQSRGGAACGPCISRAC